MPCTVSEVFRCSYILHQVNPLKTKRRLLYLKTVRTAL